MLGDVTKASTHDSAVAEAVRRWGRLDVYVNNAAIGRGGGVLDAKACPDCQPVMLIFKTEKSVMLQNQLIAYGTLGGGLGGCDGGQRQGVLAGGEGGGDAVPQARAPALERTARQDHQYQESHKLKHFMNSWMESGIVTSIGLLS